MPSQPTFLTYAEAAELLGVTEHWLRKAVREQRVAHSRLSDRVIRFTPEDIEAIRAASRVEPKATKPTKSGPTPSRRRAG
jgi:excisionase family DNA binding protein